MLLRRNTKTMWMCAIPMPSKPHTCIILLHHSRDQTTLSSCKHLSSIHCHCISLFTLETEAEWWEQKDFQTCRRFPHVYKGVLYHDFFQTFVHRRGIVAWNHWSITPHTIDAPCITFGRLSETHSTPSDGTWSGRAPLWKENCNHKTEYTIYK